MEVILIILSILASLLLIGVVLIQKSKGGGLSSTFAGSNQIMGVRRTNNFIEKVTWSLAGAIALFSVLCAWFAPNAIDRGASTTIEQQAPANPQQTSEQAPGE